MGTTQFTFGTEIDFGFADFLPKAGQQFEFLTTSDLLLTPSDSNIHMGVFKSSASGVSNFDYEIKSTPTSLILVALSDAQPIPEPQALVLTGFALVIIGLRRRSLQSMDHRRSVTPPRAGGGAARG